MPFTLAHPAAVLPIGRRFPRATVFSALIVGSMTPDLAYFIPFDVTRAASHSVPGLVTFCLPMGLASYLAFHLLFKRPLVALLPGGLASRMHAGVARVLPSRSAALVVLSLLIGAASHIAWDSFTHDNGQAVVRLTFLRATLFTVSGVRVAPYKLLQHASTLFGLGVVALAARHALREAVPGPVSVLPRPLAAFVILVLLAVPVAAGIFAARDILGPDVNLFHLHGYAFAVVVNALRTFTLALVLYACAWQIWHMVRHPADVRA